MKHVVFDFGQVLAHFEPSYMVGRCVTLPSNAALLEEIVFDRLYWDQLDAGTMTNEETMSVVKTCLPERLGDVAQEIFYSWIYNIPDMMADFLSSEKISYKIPKTP